VFVCVCVYYSKYPATSQLLMLPKIEHIDRAVTKKIAPEGATQKLVVGFPPTPTSLLSMRVQYYNYFCVRKLQTPDTQLIPHFVYRGCWILSLG